MEPIYEAVQVLPDGGTGIIIARGSEQHVKTMAQLSQINPNKIVMTPESDIRLKHMNWRKSHGNRRPNRAIVRMHWKDETVEESHVETIGILFGKEAKMYTENIPDDNNIVFYVNNLKELISLLEPNNSSDFILEGVEEFYKYY